MTEIAKLKTAKYRYTMLMGQSGSDRDWAQVRFGTYERYVRVYSLPGIGTLWAGLRGAGPVFSV